MGTIEFVEKVLEVLRDMDDAVDVICNLDAKTVVERMKFADVIIIPKGATNGDMIKIVFPSSEVRETMDDLVHYTLDGYVGAYTTKDWWNAPYKAESEDKE